MLLNDSICTQELTADKIELGHVSDMPEVDFTCRWFSLKPLH